MSPRTPAATALRLLAAHWNVVSAIAGGLTAAVAIALLPSLLEIQRFDMAFAVFHCIVSVLSGLLVWQCLQERMLRTLSLVLAALALHVVIGGLPALVTMAVARSVA